MTSSPRPSAAPTARVTPADAGPAPRPPAAATATVAAGAVDAGPAASPPDPRGVTVLVCTTCRGPDGLAASPEPGETLLAAVRDAVGGIAPGDAIRVRGVACLANCERRLSAALVADGGWTYVFGRLGLADAADLLAGAALLADAGGGVLPWRGRPDCLKRGLVARIPPLSLVEP